jgi:hypothetical protein
MLTLHTITVPIFIRAFTNLAAILKKAEDYALTNNIDPKTLVTASLHEDMADLAYQIQRCSDTAKFTCVRIAGSANVVLADTETTFAELQTRIAKTIELLKTVDDEKPWAEKETAEIKFKFGVTDMTWSGKKYVTEFALPNFFFHFTTAYDILRHKGVPLGKTDFLVGGFM